jgi:uncharacterized protein (TIGR02118 family)
VATGSADDAAASTVVTLHAVLYRRSDLTHDEFLAYWHDVHGPLIRDMPELTRHLLDYRQHPRLPASGGLGPDQPDGVTVQRFASWDVFMAFLAEPGAKAMNDDMANFLDIGRLTVSFTAAPVEVV